MNTPREVLFRRHDVADAKLDALRREVVTQLPAPPALREPLPCHIALTVWREEILTAANQAASSAPAPRSTPHRFLATFTQALATLMRPRRLAWASVGVTWVVIICLNWASSDTSGRSAISVAQLPPSPESRRALHQQLLLYTELVGQLEHSPARRLPTPRTSPRSQGNKETATG